MIAAEDYIFKKYMNSNMKDVPLVFILGSPRTGSTLLYQLMINFFDFFYFSNLTNNFFGETPAIGALVHKIFDGAPVSYKSNYGKTQEMHEPSEASVIMAKWFGGSHPSQTKSCQVLSTEKDHMINTLNSIYHITDKPILIKNAWNCFRIQNLSELFPNSKFVWIRRDITSCATSDLNSRINRGSPHVWNSATTHNYKEIQKKPPSEQVVLQQYEYNKAIEKELFEYAYTNCLEIWYEDLCGDTEYHLKRLEDFLKMPLRKRDIPNIEKSNSPSKNKDISNFVKQHISILEPYMRE